MIANKTQINQLQTQLIEMCLIAKEEYQLRKEAEDVTFKLLVEAGHWAVQATNALNLVDRHYHEVVLN